MDRKEAFNLLFDEGFDYSTYSKRTKDHKKRMESGLIETEKYLDEFDQETLNKANTTMKVLVIAENWCGDCGNGVPTISKLAEKMNGWDFRIVARDDNEKLIAKYYTTSGKKKIPVMIFANENGEEIDRWVERPRKNYIAILDLMVKNLSQDEYLKLYKKLPEVQIPQINHNIIDEVLEIAIKSATMLRILQLKQ